MFNIGFGEMAIICIVLIIAVGPERLPSMMKTLGKTLRTLRQASRDIRASTGIDELLREDFDIYTPPPRRPATVPPSQVPSVTDANLPAEIPGGSASLADVAQTGDSLLTSAGASSPAQQTPAIAVAPVAAEPKPISREDVIDLPPPPPPLGRATDHGDEENEVVASATPATAADMPATQSASRDQHADPHAERKGES